MRVAVLGGRGGSGQPSVSPRERAVLEALLAVRPGEARPSLLAEAVWGDAPPATWAKQIQAAVGHLRKVLGAEAIATTQAGYRIVPPDEGGTCDVDVDEFEEAIARSRQYAAAGEQQRAVTGLERALGLWHHPPFEALADWGPAHDEATRVAALRESARDDLLEARLASGDHRAVAEQAPAMVATDPYRERRWHALALAQYRCERQAEALATVRRAQRLLVDDLGIDPGPSLVALERAILDHDEALLATPTARPPSRDCPYKGLAEYGPEDAELFFGREADVEAALETIARTRFLTLTGPSGIGKSSILGAGVVPALRRRGADPLLIRGRATVEDVRRGSPDRPVVIDDLGASLADPDTGAALCEALAAAYENGTSVAIAVQSRHLDAVAAQAAIGGLVTRGVHVIAPPGAEAIRAVIEQPALHSGLTIEHGLVDVILHDASRVDAALPLLSHALAATWERRDGSTLTIEAYESTGGLAGAVARSAERVFINLGAAERDECRALMRRLVAVDAAGSVTLHAADRAAVEATAARTEAAARLVSARLLVARADDYLLAHEALSREWPRLAAWLDEDAATHRLVAELAAAARTWDSGERSSDDLYRGARLASAVAWDRSAGEALAEVERAFLDASVDQEARLAAAAAEETARAGRERRRARRLAVTGSVAAVAALALGVTAVAAQRASHQRAEEAAVATLTREAGDMADRSRTTAALIAVELYERWPDDPRTRAALFDIAASHPDLVRTTIFAGQGGTGVTRASSGDLLLVEPGGYARVRPGDLKALWHVDAPEHWNERGRRAVAAAPGAPVAVVLAESSECPASDPCAVLTTVDLRDGRTIATTQAPGALTVATDLATPIAIDADGEHVATVNRGRGSVEIRDAATLSLLHEVHVSAARYDEGVALAAAPDGDLVITQPGRVRVIEPATGAEVHAFTVLASATGGAAAIAADGTLLSAGATRVAAVDLRRGATLWTTESAATTSGRCVQVVIHDASRRGYCGGPYGMVTEWGLDGGALTGRTFQTQHGIAGQLAVAGSTLVASAAAAPVVTVWALDGEGPVRRSIAPDRVIFDGWDPAQRRLLVGTRPDGEQTFDMFADFAAWDVASDRAAPSLVGDDGAGRAWVGADAVAAYSFLTLDLARFDLATQGRTVAYPDVPADSPEVVSRDLTRTYVLDSVGGVFAYHNRTGEWLDFHVAVEGTAASASTSPDGRLLVVVSRFDNGDTGAQVFDARTARPLSRFVPDIREAAVNDAGDVIAATPSGVVRFRTDLTAVADSESSDAHVASIELSDAGDLFAVDTESQVSTVYSTDSGARIAGPISGDSPLESPSALRPDGGAIAVTTGTGIDVWSIDPAVLRDAACAAAGRDLTAAEWEAHLAPLGGWRSTCGFGADPAAASS